MSSPAEPPALLHCVRLLEEIRKVSEIYEPMCLDTTNDLSDVSVLHITSLKAIAAARACPALSEMNFMPVPVMRAYYGSHGHSLTLRASRITSRGNKAS